MLHEQTFEPYARFFYKPDAEPAITLDVRGDENIGLVSGYIYALNQKSPVNIWDDSVKNSIYSARTLSESDRYSEGELEGTYWYKHRSVLLRDPSVILPSGAANASLVNQFKQNEAKIVGSFSKDSKDSLYPYLPAKTEPSADLNYWLKDDGKNAECANDAAVAFNEFLQKNYRDPRTGEVKSFSELIFGDVSTPASADSESPDEVRIRVRFAKFASASYRIHLEFRIYNEGAKKIYEIPAVIMSDGSCIYMGYKKLVEATRREFQIDEINDELERLKARR